MKKYFLVLIIAILSSGFIFAQDESEENVIAEKYSKEQLKEEENLLTFEQNFLDAIQKRATENYNKALELLSICETIYPANVAMLYEKAKNHFSLNQYLESLYYCDLALAKEPANFWVKSLKKNIYLKQRNLPEALVIQKELYLEKSSEAENLLNIYFQLKDVQNGMILLKEIDKNAIYVTNLKFYKQYFNPAEDVNDQSNVENTDNEIITEEVSTEKVVKSTQNFKEQVKILETLLNGKDFENLLKKSNALLEFFPTEPLSYLYNGIANNSLKKYNQAQSILENGLDFVLDDTILLKKFYDELIIAYTQTGNLNKANTYKQLVQKLR